MPFLFTYRSDVVRGMKKDQADLRKKGRSSDKITVALVMKWNPSRMEFDHVRTGRELIEGEDGRKMPHPFATKDGREIIRQWNKNEAEALSLPPITSIRKTVVKANGKQGTRHLLGLWVGASLNPSIDHWGKVIEGAQEKHRKLISAADEQTARIMRRRMKRLQEEIYDNVH